MIIGSAVRQITTTIVKATTSAASTVTSSLSLLALTLVAGAVIIAGAMLLAKFLEIKNTMDIAELVITYLAQKWKSEKEGKEERRGEMFKSERKERSSLLD